MLYNVVTNFKIFAENARNLAFQAFGKKERTANENTISQRVYQNFRKIRRSSCCYGAFATFGSKRKLGEFGREFKCEFIKQNRFKHRNFNERKHNAKHTKQSTSVVHHRC